MNGAYAFTNLVPAIYSVGFAPPPGYQITLQDQGGDALDSDADRTTGRTVQTTLVSGENDPDWDAGLYVPASLGDFVWNDLDANGAQDGGETGVVGVVVTLYSDIDDSVVGVTTTDVAGAYAFTNLIPGAYYVGVAVPGGWDVSPQDQAGDALDSDVDVATGLTATITLVSGQNDPDWDAGLYLPASLGDFVWLDVDGDGVQGGAGETGMPDVVVTLYDATNGVAGTTTTDVNGAYAFTNLVPGSYTVGFAAPLGFALTLQNQGGDAADSDADRTTGLTAPTVLVSGENDPTWDAGLYVPASLGDFVWHDLNYDGLQTGGEPGVPGVRVELYDAATNLVDARLTDTNGFYLFDDLIPGEYTVAFVRPAGYRFTLQDQSGADAADSDADPITGRAIATVLVSGENDLTWDAGLYLPASVGDYVWLDENWDGVQDPGERGLPNVIVQLLDGGGIRPAIAVVAVLHVVAALQAGHPRHRQEV